MTMSRKEKRLAERQQKSQNKLNQNAKKAIIDVAIQNYSVAMLYILRKEMKYGKKRAARFSGWISQLFDDINDGKVSLGDLTAVVEAELGIVVE